MSKILRMQATNFMRLKVVEITPDGNLVTIAGRNAQGKSSVLKAISAALAGTNSRGLPRPVRDGESDAEIIVETDDLIVTRRFTAAGKTTLTVTSPDGAVYPKGQAKLDAMLGKLALDPIAFTLLSDRDQRDQLMSIVDLPFDPAEVDQLRKTKFDERTDVNRRVKDLQTRVNQYDVAKYAGLADEPVSVTTLLGQYRDAELKASAAGAALRAVNRAKTAIEEIEERLRLAKVELNLANDQYVDALDAAPPAGRLEELRDALDTVEETNRLIADKGSYVKLTVELKNEESIAAGLTAEIEAIDQEKADGLAAAKFPVDGLGFDENGVTFGGVPFKQASSAEQIRVSFAMAAATNPDLRVIRIADGSLLDSDTLKTIAAMAEELDYQVWIEVVSDGDGDGIVIEDGEILAVDY